MAIKVFTVKEKTTSKYTATLKDEDGTAIALASLTTLTLTLYDISSTSRTIINSRNAQNVLNANNVTVHATSGLLTWEMQAADNEIQDSNKKIERHRALFKFSWSGGQGIHEVDFDVENIEKNS